jgi:hypothetical protein
MKLRTLAQPSAMALLALWLAGCVCTPPPEPPAARLVSPLVKLTAAVEAEIRDSPSGPPASDDQLLAVAMKGKPELKRAFQDVPLKVRRDSRNVVLLVCSPDGRFAWLEDASWTTGVDIRWYQSQPPHPAAFSLDPAQATSH